MCLLQFIFGEGDTSVYEFVNYSCLHFHEGGSFSSTSPLEAQDELTAFPVGGATASRSLVLDESSFHTNEGQSVLWAEEGRVPIRPKSQGRRLMVSDFVTEHHGLLQLNEEEYEEVHQSDASIPQCAREIFKFGVANEGYWNSERS